MIYCKKCGSELKGAKNFCIVCGAKQNIESKPAKGPKPEPKRPKKTEEEDSGTCVKCGEDTEKKCFFCGEFVCREHYIRMQANVLPVYDMNEYKTHEETKRINEGWRGFIISACSKCSGLKAGKHLTDTEADEISTMDHCTWYKLDF